MLMMFLCLNWIQLIANQIKYTEKNAIIFIKDKTMIEFGANGAFIRRG